MESVRFNVRRSIVRHRMLDLRYVFVGALVAVTVGARRLVSIPGTDWLLSDVGIASLLIAWMARWTQPASEGTDLRAGPYALQGTRQGGRRRRMADCHLVGY